MYKPTVRAVHRVKLDTDRTGQITAGHLNMNGHAFDDGATVVLECGSGYWIRESELQHICSALSNVSYVSITTCTESPQRGGAGHFGTISGVDAIARRMGELLAMPPLFETA
jgi:hypothetical protein